MPEYHNIMTRMLGADSFPYRNIVVDDDLYDLAIKALRNFFFIGLQEEFEISVQLLLREMHFPSSIASNITIAKEREQTSNRKISKEKKEIRTNESLMARIRIANIFDIRLYRQGNLYI